MKKYLGAKNITICTLLTIIPLASINAKGGGTVGPSGPIEVTATVTPSCTVTVNPIAFGNYTLTETTAQADIRVTCTAGTIYNIVLDAGSHTDLGATTTLRVMADSNNQPLHYALYQDNSRTTIWGDGSDKLSGQEGNATEKTHTVYGKIPAGENAPLGDYSDNVNVVVEFSS